MRTVVRVDFVLCFLPMTMVMSEIVKCPCWIDVPLVWKSGQDGRSASPLEILQIHKSVRCCYIRQSAAAMVFFRPVGPIESITMVQVQVGTYHPLMSW